MYIINIYYCRKTWKVALTKAYQTLSVMLKKGDVNFMTPPFLLIKFYSVYQTLHLQPTE